MRRVTITFLALWAVSNPTFAQGTSILAPKLVIDLAGAYAASHPDDAKASGGQTFVGLYAYEFFEGFTNPDSRMLTKSEWFKDAYEHGQSYWREHPSQREQIFAGYGYKRIEANGRVSHGFEKSSFVPSDGQEEWWFSPLGTHKWSDIQPNQPPPYVLGHISIVGYLSPTGHYGHLGAYSHEVLVVSYAPASGKR